MQVCILALSHVQGVYMSQTMKKRTETDITNKMIEVMKSRMMHEYDKNSGMFKTQNKKQCPFENGMAIGIVQALEWVQGKRDKLDTNINKR